MKESDDKMGGSEEDFLSWIDERFIKSFGAVYCLALISKGYKHGYDIMKYIEKEHCVKPSAGSFYPLLQYLEDHGYVKGEWEYTEGKPGKKLYDLTPKGTALLMQAEKRLHELISTLHAKRAG